MKKIAIALAALATLCMLVCFASAAQAGSTNANLDVSVDVDAACTITTTAVAFPMYTPIGNNATNPDDSTGGAVTLVCTTGASATIGLLNGNYPSGLQMRMKNAANEYLPYALYQDAGRSVVWNATTGALAVAPAPDTSPRTYQIYGRIPAGQSGGGHYTDVVIAHVDF